MHGDRPFRIRTITAGVCLDGPGLGSRFDALDGAAGVVARAGARLARARRAFEAAGYEVETVRVATSPVLRFPDPAHRTLLERLQALDRVASDSGALLSLGPIAIEDGVDARLARWVAELLATTTSVMCSVAVASPGRGIHENGVRAAAQIMAALARSTPDGRDNFRFAAAASIPPGTPFFPVSYHEGPDGMAIGLEAAPVVAQVCAGRPPLADASACLREALDAAFAEVERLARELAAHEGVLYGGIDPSPAPLGDRSIAAAIESLTASPFGSASTLRACAIVTEALKSLRVQTCGYAGLMLPVLEDNLLAKRAGEGRYGLRDLLLYSSVCGTGLDVVPLPGDTSIDTLARIVGDVATLSVRLDKPLSARLCLVPRKKAGELATFDNPYLTDCVVFEAD